MAGAVACAGNSDDPGRVWQAVKASKKAAAVAIGRWAFAIFIVIYDLQPCAAHFEKYRLMVLPCFRRGQSAIGRVRVTLGWWGAAKRDKLRGPLRMLRGKSQRGRRVVGQSDIKLTHCRPARVNLRRRRFAPLDRTAAQPPAAQLGRAVRLPALLTGLRCRRRPCACG